MTRKALYSLILSLLLFASLSPRALAFTGAVVNSDGNGIVAARVLLFVGESVSIAYSGENGRYTFPDLTENTQFQLHIFKTGYPAAVVNGNSNNYEALTTILQTAQVTLSGIVLYPDGSPIAGVEIDAGALGTSSTNAQGEFSFSSTQGQSYQLHAAAADLLFPASISGTLTGNTVRVIIGDLD